MKDLNLRAKMILYIGVVTFLSFAFTIGFVAVKAGSMAREEAMEKAGEIAHRYSGVVKVDVEVALDTVRTMAHTFEGFKLAGTVPEREVLDQVLKQVLSRNPSFLGVWTGWEPDALDGRDSEFAGAGGHDSTGRYVPYWFMSGGMPSVDPLVDYDKEGAGDYYLLSQRSGDETVIEPYLYPVNGKDTLITSVVAPVRVNGRVLGVVGIDVALSTFQELFSKIRIYDTGYLSIVSNGGYYVSHPNAERIGKELVASDPWAAPFLGRIKSGELFDTTNQSKSLGSEVARISVPVTFGRSKAPWAVIVNIPIDEILEKANQIQYVTMGIGSIAMLVLLGTVFLVTGSITGPIRKGVDFAENMSRGDLSQTLDIRQKDEIGTLASALNEMTSSLAKMMGDVTEGVSTLSTSSSDLAAISEQMSQGAGETSGKSGAVASAAEEMSSSMSSIAAAMEQATSNVTMVASASEEMTATIGEVAKNTERARSVSGAAVNQALEVSGRMGELGNAASEIGNVTETITDISEQTNLLALNATIEAARAGEAGKGFAVVAGEIKHLASQTSDATRDIREKIAGIQQATKMSVEGIEEITQIIQEIDAIVSTTATAVEEQSATTREIAGNVAQASQGLSEINDSVAQSSTVSEEITRDIADVSRQAVEMTNSSAVVSKSANELLDLSDRLKTMIGHFKIG